MRAPLVSVITVNYRQAEVTCALLRSLRALRYPNLEVIVVDNGPTEDSRRVFAEHFPGLKIIVSRENRGFAGGNNLGLREADGDFLLLLNNDTEVADGLLENLLRRFDTPGVGAVSPKIRYFDQPDRIQYAGFTPVNPLTGRNQAIGKGELDRGQHDTARATPYAHGAAMMLSRAALEHAGEMPEEFFLYYEELDWCASIRRAGFSVWYEPAASVLHKESISTGRNSPFKTEMLTRSRLRFMRRNFGGLRLGLFYLFFGAVSFPAGLFRRAAQGNWADLRAFWRGVFGKG